MKRLVSIWRRVIAMAALVVGAALARAVGFRIGTEVSSSARLDKPKAGFQTRMARSIQQSTALEVFRFCTTHSALRACTVKVVPLLMEGWVFFKNYFWSKIFFADWEKGLRLQNALFTTSPDANHRWSFSKILGRIADPVEAFDFMFISHCPLLPLPERFRNGPGKQADLFEQMEDGHARQAWRGFTMSNMIPPFLAKQQNHDDDEENESDRASADPNGTGEHWR